MDVDRWNALPVQSFPYSSRRITLVFKKPFPFYSLPYFSFERNFLCSGASSPAPGGTNGRRPAFQLWTTAPSLAWVSFHEQWTGLCLIIKDRTSHSSPWSGRRPPRPPLELRAVQGKTGGWVWQHLTPGCDTDTMQESWWFAQVSCRHISLQLEQWTGQFLFICSCGGLHVFGNHTETITSSISTQLNKVVTFLKSTSRTFVPSNR